MIDLLKSGIVRILNQEKIPIGAGFLVSGQYVCTYAHVIQATTTMNQEPFPNVGFDFPLVEPGTEIKSEVHHFDPIEDIATLLAIDDLPIGVNRLPLVDQNNLWKHSFRSAGFIEEYPNGIWADGELRDSDAKGWLQILDTKQTGYFVEPGFSGSPVWDELLDGVVGMIAATDQDIDRKIAFCIPSELIMKAWFTQNGRDKTNILVTSHPINHLQYAVDLLTQVQLVFSQPSIYPSECTSAAKQMGQLWDDHIIPVYQYLNSLTSLSNQMQSIRKHMRYSIDATRRDIQKVIILINEFREISLEESTNKSRKKQKILSLLEQIKTFIPHI